MTKVACMYRPDGCPELLAVKVVSEHEALCPHVNKVRCMVVWCTWMGLYNDAFRHVSCEHQFSAYDVSVTYHMSEFYSLSLPNVKMGSQKHCFFT